MSVVQRLELFRERAEELRQARFLRDTLAAGYELKIEAQLIPGTEDQEDQYETTFTMSPYDAEYLRSFLTFFRRFFLNNDPVVNLFSIYNLCHQHLTEETYKAFLAKSRKIAMHALKTSAFHLRINDQDISPEFVSDMWINGYYFHDNIDHYFYLRTLSPTDHMLLNINFFDYLRDMTRQILYVSSIINAALNEGCIQ